MAGTEGMKSKLTKRVVEGAKPGPRDLFLWDAQVPGFGCKVTPKGRRVFILQYWAHGRSRRMTLGRFGVELTVDQARTKAKRLRGQVADGGDPAAAWATVRAMPALAGLAERYLSDHAAVKKKRASYEADKRNLNNHIRPALGRLRVDAITRADVARLHAGMRETPIQANRCLALLSKMFALSEAWGLRPDGSNPTRHIEKYPERKVERFLSNAEPARLRKRAGLEDVRLHDLRQTHASVGASTGESLVLIGALLGHRQAATTQRYAHLSDDPVKAAADRIAGHLAAAMADKSGKVIALRSGEEPEFA